MGVHQLLAMSTARRSMGLLLLATLSLSALSVNAQLSTGNNTFVGLYDKDIIPSGKLLFCERRDLHASSAGRPRSMVVSGLHVSLISHEKAQLGRGRLEAAKISRQQHINGYLCQMRQDCQIITITPDLINRYSEQSIACRWLRHGLACHQGLADQEPACHQKAIAGGLYLPANLPQPWPARRQRSR